MPQDRLRNRAAGRSVKLCQLTDLEFRVWDQYELSADDFGLMRCSALTIQDDNDALAQRPQKAVQKALERLVSLELLLVYEHQGRRYVCDPRWQTFQKIDYPSQTLNPMPPASALSKCDAHTQELFSQCFGKKSVKFRKPSDVVLENSEKEIGKFTVSATRDARERQIQTQALTQTPERESERKQPERTLAIVEPEIGDRAAAVVERFGALYAELRKGAKYLRQRPALDWDRAMGLCRTWDDGRLEKLMRIFLTTDDEWIARTGREFGVFVSKATWCDDRLREWEAKQRVSA